MSLLLQVVLAMLLLMKRLGLDLLASALARTQVEAVQFAVGVMLPPGFVIPRGAILRGAGLVDRLPSGAGLVTCWVVLMSNSVGRFRKQVE